LRQQADGQPRRGGSATIGGEGVGVLTIEDLGVVSMDSVIVGGTAGGSGTITVRGVNAIRERADLRAKDGDLVLGNGDDGNSGRCRGLLARYPSFRSPTSLSIVHRQLSIVNCPLTHPVL